MHPFLMELSNRLRETDLSLDHSPQIILGDQSDIRHVNNLFAVLPAGIGTVCGRIVCLRKEQCGCDTNIASLLAHVDQTSPMDTPAGLRPMEADDVTGCGAVFTSALSALRSQMGLSPSDRGHVAALERIAHLHSTDPEGSWVVQRENTVIGFTQAAIRDEVWVLAHLFVLPDHQEQGTGATLLEHAHRYGIDTPRGMIGATPDPRAIRRYAQLPGFEVHPALSAFGAMTPDRIPPTPRVRPGATADLDLAIEIDRWLRGGAHGVDLELLLAGPNASLLIVDDRGYAVATTSGPAVLAAADQDTALDLLLASLRHVPPGSTIEFGRITGEQQWAIRALVEVGFRFRPWGPLVLRGFSPPRPYLPHPALC
jgi:GNAT superfamily N-acetyltransferase